MPRHFPHWLRAYLSFTEESESPAIFHFWTGVATIAGALRRRVRVYERQYDIVPNFYTILVAPAGVAKKSTSVNLGIELLEQVPDIHFGPNSGSWQGVADSLQQSLHYYKTNPQDENEKPRPMSAITIAASELGTFLRPDDSQAMSFLTDMWDGKRHKFRHQTRHAGSIEILNPWMNIIGATTPSWIRENIPENMIGDGLLSRVIFVYADKKRRSIARPSKLIPARDYEETQRKLVEDLTHISLLAGDYDYAPDADEWMEKWYTALDAGPRPLHLASERFSGYLGRKQIHLVKLAMVIAAAQRDELLLTVDDFETALGFLEECEHFMLSVFESISDVTEVKHIAEMLAFVRAHQEITADDLYMLCYNVMSKMDFERALINAVQGRALTVVNREGKRLLTATQRTGLH